MFVEEELFEGNNLYRCAQCDRLVTAAKVSVWNGGQVYIILTVQVFDFHLPYIYYLVCQTQETPSVLDGVFVEIQLRLCQM